MTDRGYDLDDYTDFLPLFGDSIEIKGRSGSIHAQTSEFAAMLRDLRILAELRRQTQGEHDDQHLLRSMIAEAERRVNEKERV